MSNFEDWLKFYGRQDKTEINRRYNDLERFFMNQPKWISEVEPTYDGMARVYRIAEPDLATDDPKMKAHVPTSNYLIFAPAAHPMWSWHVMMCVNLRPQEGLPPAHLHYPGAQFELMVFALDPDHEPPDPREWKPKKWKFLQPQDVVVQFHGPDDEQVKEMLEKVAEAVANGYLVPDSDYRSHWEGVIQKTAEHYRGHPELN